MQSLGSDDHSCHGGYRIASRKMHIGSRPSHLSPRSIASVALDQHQYADSICQGAINEPPNRRKAKEDLPVSVHAGLIEPFLSTVAIPLLSKLSNI